MKQRLFLTIAGFAVTALLVLVMVTFTVREDQVKIVTTFGKIDRAITEAGLYVRWPLPIQKVHTYDNRRHLLPGAFEQTLTLDGKNILAGVYAGWRIADPVQFFEGLGDIRKAESNLDGLIRNYKNTILGKYPFSSLVNVDPEKLKFEQIEQEILAAVQPEALERYGIDVSFIGFRKIGLPPNITEKVFERMRAERESVSERYLSEGEGEAIKIRAEADSQRDQILAEAEAGAKRIRAEGDAAAATYYKTFEENPELANFLKKLEVLEETLKTKSTVILSSDTAPYDLLRGTESKTETTAP